MHPMQTVNNQRGVDRRGFLSTIRGAASAVMGAGLFGWSESLALAATQNQNRARK